MKVTKVFSVLQLSHDGPRVVVRSLQLAGSLDVAPHDVVSSCPTVGSGPGLRCVGEGEAGGVDDPVITD